MAIQTTRPSSFFQSQSFERKLEVQSVYRVEGTKPIKGEKIGSDGSQFAVSHRILAFSSFIFYSASLSPLRLHSGVTFNRLF